jgi:type VI secretion system protein ImpG
MNREFLEFYDRELKILYERSQEFAEEFPGVAARLGAMTEAQIDPTIAGLLEGAAFLAARVQLKLKSEFSNFTIEMLDHLLPGILAPSPSFALLKVRPDYSNPILKDGLSLKAGEYVDTGFLDRERRVACRYRLVSDLTIWPYAVSRAEYLSTPAPLQARGLNSAPSIAGGLCIELSLRSAKQGADTSGPGDAVSTCTPDSLTFHFVDALSDSAALYELMFSRLRRIVIRHGRDGEAPKFQVLGLDAIEAIGFERGESLFGHDDRVFAGFSYLREYFAFPSKFLGFRLKSLSKYLKRIEADRFEVYFEFDASTKRLASVVKASSFALYAAPASNLFEVSCTPVPIRSQDHEHVVIADRSRPLDHEIFQILEVTAQYPRRKDKVPVFPLYSAPSGNIALNKAHFFTSRKLERRKTDIERRTGVTSSYLGTDTFISLREPPEEEAQERVRSLNIRALVTNRHLTDKLPLGRGSVDFTSVSDTKLELECIAGPTPPRESLLVGAQRGRGGELTGSVLWKLISLLQFNHLGLAGRAAGDQATALREILLVFADASNPDIERRIRGVVDIKTSPVVRKISQENGFNAARGIQVAVEFDESAFEGSGAFLLGAVLSRFFCEYASFNSFVETVIKSRQRGEIMKWRPAIGARQLL